MLHCREYILNLINKVLFLSKCNCTHLLRSQSPTNQAFVRNQSYESLLSCCLLNIFQLRPKWAVSPLTPVSGEPKVVGTTARTAFPLSSHGICEFCICVFVYLCICVLVFVCLYLYFYILYFSPSHCQSEAKSTQHKSKNCFSPFYTCNLCRCKNSCKSPVSVTGFFLKRFMNLAMPWEGSRKI